MTIADSKLATEYYGVKTLYAIDISKVLMAKKLRNFKRTVQLLGLAPKSGS